jgi:hypothetical protein
LSGSANAGGTVGTQANSGASNIAGSTSQPNTGISAGAGLNAQQQLQADGTNGLAGQTNVGANVNAGVANANVMATNDANARWRFRQHNGEWWYWTPRNTWMYHRNGNWVAYDQATYTVPQVFVPRTTYGYRGDAGLYYSQPMYRGYGYSDDFRYRSGYRGNYGYGSGYGYGNAYVDPGYAAGVNVGSAIGGAVGGNRGANIGGAIGGVLGSGR